MVAAGVGIALISAEWAAGYTSSGRKVVSIAGDELANANTIRVLLLLALGSFAAANWGRVSGQVANYLGSGASLIVAGIVINERAVIASTPVRGRVLDVGDSVMALFLISAGLAAKCAFDGYQNRRSDG